MTSEGPEQEDRCELTQSENPMRRGLENDGKSGRLHGSDDVNDQPMSYLVSHEDVELAILKELYRGGSQGHRYLVLARARQHCPTSKEYAVPAWEPFSRSDLSHLEAKGEILHFRSGMIRITENGLKRLEESGVSISEENSAGNTETSAALVSKLDDSVTEMFELFPHMTPSQRKSVLEILSRVNQHRLEETLDSE